MLFLVITGSCAKKDQLEPPILLNADDGFILGKPIYV